MTSTVDPDREAGEARRRLLAAGLDLPERGTGARAARRRPSTAGAQSSPPVAEERRGPTRRWMAVYGLCLTGIVLVAATLSYVGLRTVRESRAGRVLTSVTDPALPGFEAFVEPSPTLLVLHSVDGLLRSVAVLSLNSGDSGGSVLLIPPSTLVGRGDDAHPLSVIYAFTPDEVATSQAVESLLGIGLREVVVVDDARWAELVSPAGPIMVHNPDPIDGFPSGEITLEGDQVSTWLGGTRDDESQLARTFHQELFWRAWIEAVGQSSDPHVVPGEVSSGIGRFVRGLASGPTRLAVLPSSERLDDFGQPTVTADAPATRALIAELVPFPTAGFGVSRPKVRLLDGTGDRDQLISAAPLLVAAGAEIVVAGNAASFDHRITEVRYHVPEAEAAARDLRAGLGRGRVVEDARQTDAFDVTIVLGPDS